MLGKVNAVVLFVQDLEKCLMFYRDIVGLTVTFSDDVSCAIRLEDQDFVLLKLSAAANMITEEAVSLHSAGGHRVLLCVETVDIDALYTTLTARGVQFIKPPIDQVWGRRTAYFADPEGNLWELFQMLEEQA